MKKGSADSPVGDVNQYLYMHCLDCLISDTLSGAYVNANTFSLQYAELHLTMVSCTVDVVDWLTALRLFPPPDARDA